MAATSLRLGNNRLLSADNIQALAARRITTISGLLSAPRNVLSEVTGLTKAEIAELRDYVLSEVSAVPYLSFDSCQGARFEISAELQSIHNSLDKYLPSGGLDCGQLTELFGASSSGKTQLCLQVASVYSVKGFKVAYVDSDGSFSCQRIITILDEYVQVPNNIETSLRNIDYFRVFNEQDLLQTLKQLSVATTPYKLVVIDSLASIMVPILCRTHSLGFAILTQIGRLMLKIARQRNACVLCTNYGHSTGKGAVEKPALGVAWSHIPCARIHVKRSSTISMATRITTLVKSTGTPTGTQAVFELQ